MANHIDIGLDTVLGLGLGLGLGGQVLGLGLGLEGCGLDSKSGPRCHPNLA